MAVNSNSWTTRLVGGFRPRVSVGPTPGVWLISLADKFWWSWQIKHSAPVFDFDELPVVLPWLICVATSAAVDCVVLESDSPDLAPAP